MPSNILGAGNTQSIKTRSLPSNNLASKHRVDQNSVERRWDGRLFRLFWNRKTGMDEPDRQSEKTS